MKQIVQDYSNIVMFRTQTIERALRGDDHIDASEAKASDNSSPGNKESEEILVSGAEDEPYKDKKEIKTQMEFGEEEMPVLGAELRTAANNPSS